MSEGPGGPQGATAGGTLAMRMLSQQAMVASQMKRAANDKAIAQMLAAKKSGPPAARLGDEIQHKSFLGALAGAVLGAIVTIAEGCLIMAACATGAKWHLNRSQFGIRIDHDLASISDHSLASQSITIWHAS
ncbi:hypothetical protein, partial [Escherichia coli]|uniref:hypothetical protein n=1 Tax=Escherichia coli TaxID=562 RepID=UPI00203D7420